jgi:hypothetical protein
MMWYDVGVTRRGCSTWPLCVGCMMGDTLDDWMGLAFLYVPFSYDVAMVGIFMFPLWDLPR